MGHVLGIDLGTTFSCMAHLEQGKPQVIPNRLGEPTTPSIITFTKEGGVYVGNLALRQAILNPENTIYAVKRLIGKKYDSPDVREAQKRMSYRVVEAANGDILIQSGSQTVTPQEVSALVLRYLKECAEDYLNDQVTEAILTVPAHFNDHQRHATLDAARIAGINVIRMINEPTAASLAYGLGSEKSATLAVYDMGGGTFDITIMEISDGVFHVLATGGNSFLGGEDFDNCIMDWLLDSFKDKHKVDLRGDAMSVQRLREAAEKAKRNLTNNEQTEISIPFLYADASEAIHLQTQLTRNHLEEMTKGLVEKTIPYLEQALHDCRLKPENIDRLLLIGGQTRMPLIQRRITEFFRQEPAKGVNPDESVALGASVQGGILQGSTKDLVLLLDVTPLSLGIETENGQFVRVIDKNTTIPTKKTLPFTTVEDNQTKVKIHVLQGDSDKVVDNTSLGEFSLVGIGSAPAGVPQIDVTFEIDADGIVRVSARDVATKTEQSIELKPSSGLLETEIHDIILRQKHGGISDK